MFNGARILVAPLDWGLGHAARDVPVVRRLIDLGATPIIGADGGPLELLRQEFPDLECVRMPGHRVTYGAGSSQAWAMLRQLPGMLRSIREEHTRLERTIIDQRIDAVISDQRFGLWSGKVPSVLITHQVFPLTPFAQAWWRRWNLRQLARFDRVWIPDSAEAPGSSGDLSHAADPPPQARSIGPLSRLKKVPRNDLRYRSVAVISGPEPQRTLFERILMDQMSAIDGQHLIVCGLPGTDIERRMGNVWLIPHVKAALLPEALCAADLVITRSGYTSLMDLSALDLPALIVPTPGQPEQEYLAKLHAGTGRFLVQQQKAIDLRMALGSLAAGGSHTNSEQLTMNNDLLDRALQELATLIRQ